MIRERKERGRERGLLDGKREREEKNGNGNSIRRGF